MTDQVMCAMVICFSFRRSAHWAFSVAEPHCPMQRCVHVYYQQGEGETIHLHIKSKKYMLSLRDQFFLEARRYTWLLF